MTTGVDLFAGCGGFTLAAESEGVDVVFAANHWDLAVKVHAANHPRTRHEQQDLRQFDFSTLEPFDLLLASPSCQGHSRAGQPGRAKSKATAATHDAYRSTAWAVVDCLEVCRPRAAIIENVPEFLNWALLPSWLDALGRLGYRVTHQKLTASKWGIPQRRRRVFLIATLGQPVAVQDPVVDEPGVDTIFDPDADTWISIPDIPVRASRINAPNSQDRARIANDRLGGALGWGMHVSYRGAWGRPASEPVATLTCAAGQLWWVRDGMYRFWTAGERKRAMDFPVKYDMCGATKSDVAKLLGNAVPPGMAAGVIRAVRSAL